MSTRDSQAQVVCLYYRYVYVIVIANNMLSIWFFSTGFCIQEPTIMLQYRVVADSLSAACLVIMSLLLFML